MKKYQIMMIGTACTIMLAGCQNPLNMHVTQQSLEYSLLLQVQNKTYSDLDDFIQQKKSSYPAKASNVQILLQEFFISAYQDKINQANLLEEKNKLSKVLEADNTYTQEEKEEQLVALKKNLILDESIKSYINEAYPVDKGFVQKPTFSKSLYIVAEYPLKNTKNKKKQKKEIKHVSTYLDKMVNKKDMTSFSFQEFQPSDIRYDVVTQSDIGFEPNALKSEIIQMKTGESKVMNMDEKGVLHPTLVKVLAIPLMDDDTVKSVLQYEKIIKDNKSKTIEESIFDMFEHIDIYSDKVNLRKSDYKTLKKEIKKEAKQGNLHSLEEVGKQNLKNNILGYLDRYIQ